MPDSSHGSIKSIPDITNDADGTAAGTPHSQQTQTPTSSSRAAPEGSGGDTGKKVWIPRMSQKPGPMNRLRTKHACEACRKRRIKCDGARPLCHGCASAGTECVYSDHKRVRDRQEMRFLKTTIDQYEHLLRDLLHEVPAGAAKRIQSNLKVRTL